MSSIKKFSAYFPALWFAYAINKKQKMYFQKVLGWEYYYLSTKGTSREWDALNFPLYICTCSLNKYVGDDQLK